jgi:hypothetical protein
VIVEMLIDIWCSIPSHELLFFADNYNVQASRLSRIILTRDNYARYLYYMICGIILEYSAG